MYTISKPSMTMVVQLKRLEFHVGKYTQIHPMVHTKMVVERANFIGLMYALIPSTCREDVFMSTAQRIAKSKDAAPNQKSGSLRILSSRSNDKSVD
jgi:hypothetical protein